MKTVHQRDWDRDKVWMRIDDVLQKKRRRRAIWYWCLGISGLLVLSLSTFLHFNHHESYPWKISTLPIDLPNRPLASHAISKETQTPAAVSQVPKRLPKTAATTITRPIAGIDNGATSSTANGTEVKSPTSSSVITLQEAHLLKKQNDVPPIPVRIGTIPSRDIETMPLLLPLDRPSRELPLATWTIPRSALRPKQDSRSGSSWAISLRSNWWQGAVDYVGSDAWVAAKQESEGFNFASAQELLVQFPLSQQLYGYIGISYQSIVNTYDFTSETVKVRSIQSDSAVVYEIDGLTPIFEPGILEERTSTSRQIIHNNLLHRWTIPFGFGYHRVWGKVGLGAELGASFQFWKGFDGIVMNEENRQHLLDPRISRNRYYRNRWQLNWNSAVLLSYQLDLNYQLLIGVQYQQDNLFFARGGNYRSDYQLYGIQLGVRLLLNR